MTPSNPTRFKFTEKALERLPPHPRESRSTEGEYSDTEVAGLKLLVSKSGRKFFYFRYTFAGKKRSMKVGELGALTVAEARKQALALRLQLDQGVDPQAEKAAQAAMPTFADFALKEYLPYAEQRKRTAGADESKLRVHLLPRFGRRPLDSLTTRDIQRYHAEIKEALTPATANRHLSLLSKLFKLAVQWEYLTKNPCHGVAKFQENNQRHRYLSDEEIERVRAALRTEPNQVAAAAITFLMLTGVRRNEGLQARWEHVDLEQGLLFLPDTKSGRSRHVVLNAAAVELLKRQPRVDGNPYVFPGRVAGQPLNNPVKAFKRVLAAAGVDNLRLHDLRHTFASVVVNAGGSLYDVQHLLGHASPNTSQRYAHLSKERLRAVSGLVGELVGGTKASEQESAPGAVEAATSD